MRITTVYEVVQKICLGLPETEEVVSHGFPTFKGAGKIFATYSVNHHGDGKVALILSLSMDMQKMLVDSAPKHFFVPPYTGSKGWVGVELNKGISWDRVSELTYDAYCKVTPTKVSGSANPTKVKPPTQKMKREKIDPYISKSNQTILKKLRDICLVLPETVEATQFRAPCFKAGKKTFCTLHQWNGNTEIQAWAGVDRQMALTSFDERYRAPPYSGPNGWVGFSLRGKPSWQEVSALARESYRHFAPQRMLKAMND